MPLNLDDYLARIIVNPASDAQARNEAFQELRRREETRIALGRLWQIIVLCLALACVAQLLIEERVGAGRTDQTAQEPADGGRAAIGADGGGGTAAEAALRADAGAHLDAGALPGGGAQLDGGPGDAGLPDGGVIAGSPASSGWGLFRRGMGSVGSAAAAVLWCFAWLAIGCLLGFLFGIPKIAQPQQPSQPGTPSASGPQYRQLVNTNLGEISDWLTKIFVGLGLVELKSAWPALGKVSAYMARNACAVSCVPLAGAIVLTFGVLGFLCGYLATRMYLAPAFGRADTVDPLVSVRDAKVHPPDEIPKAAASAAAATPAQKQRSAATALFADHLSDMTARDLAKAQLLQERYAEAASAYAAVAKTTDDPAVHYEYAVALSHVGDATSPEVCAELEKAASKADRLDEETRTEVFIWLTFAYLYRTEMEGYKKSIEYGEKALAMGIRSGSIFVNLACAYAQLYDATKTDAAKAMAAKSKVIEYIKRASAQGNGYRDRLRELLVKKPGKAPGDDDLETFEQDEQVRSALGL